MRLLKLALISVIFLFLVVTAISLFIPSHVRISRAVAIGRPLPIVKEQIAKPQNWKNWYPGADSAKFFYDAGTVRGIVVNEKKRQDLIIKTLMPDEVIAEYITPSNRPITVGWKMIPAANDSSITLQWYMDFHLRWYPWEKFSSLLYEKMYGSQMEKGLAELKGFVEGK